MKYQLHRAMGKGQSEHKSNKVNNKSDMSGNSSTFGNLLSSHCTNMFITVLSIRTILLLPPSIVILYLGLQKWRQQRSFKTLSHIDVFTYQLSVLELLWFFGCLFHVWAYNYGISVMTTLGTCSTYLAFYGELLFHMLTCVERYIAVIHPVTYLRLRNSSGVRIRNISVGCVWLLAFGLTSPLVFTDNYSTITMLGFLVCTIMVTCFCSFSCLCVLIRPGPREGGGEKDRVHQSKQRAFNTITAISSMQCLWFLGLIVSTVVLQSNLLNPGVSCLVGMSVSFCNLPSCLVLPLLYLYRSGTLKWLNRK